MAADSAGVRSASRLSSGRRAWVDMLLRTKRGAERDHLGMVAAGVAFYAFLSVFPALAAIVSVYGLLSDPNQVEQQLNALGSFMPGGVREILSEQLRRIAGGSSETLSWGFALSLLLALWSATKGTKSLIEAMNIAYDEQETRGLLKLNGLALVLTVGAVLTMVVALIVVVGIPTVLSFVGLGEIGRIAVDILRWPVLIGLLLVGLATVYWLGPSSTLAEWKWVTPGSLLATGLWLAASIAFSIYVANFGSYEKTYGSLGAVAILLMWFYVGSYVILLGAELNAEVKRREQQSPERRSQLEARS
jgi:membrane protein